MVDEIDPFSSFSTSIDHHHTLLENNVANSFSRRSQQRKRQARELEGTRDKL